jgi:arylsulfatase A-like enzyme
MTFTQYGSIAHLPPEVVKNARALYAGLITLVDRWFGFLLDAVQLLGLAEDTIILVNADHGTSACDRNLIGKCAPYYEEITHVPLMIHVPGMTRSKRISNLVQPVDLMPTILDLLGVAAPADYPMNGISLLPALQGKRMKTHDLAVTAEAGMLYEPGTEYVNLTSERWVLFDYPDSEKRQLFDLQNDPGQTQNVIKDHLAVADEMHAAFLEFLARHDAAPVLLDIWSGKPAPTENLEELETLVWRDSEYRDFRKCQKRGMGVTAKSYVRVAEFGEGYDMRH